MNIKEQAVREFYAQYDSMPIDTIDDIYTIGDNLIRKYNGTDKNEYIKIMKEIMKSAINDLEKSEQAHSDFYR